MKRFVIRKKEICIADFEVEAENEQDAFERFGDWESKVDNVRATMDRTNWWETSTEIVPIEDSRACEDDVLTNEDWSNL